MLGTSFSSSPNAPGAPSGQSGTGSPISAFTETEQVTSPARNKPIFMVRVVGYFASRYDLNECPVAFNEEVLNLPMDDWLARFGARPRQTIRSRRYPPVAHGPQPG